MTSKTKLFMGMALSTALLLGGCGSTQDSTKTKETKKEETHIVEDIAGNKVEVPKKINGMAITPLPWSAIVYAVDGSADHIMGAREGTKQAYDISILPKMEPKMGEIDTSYIDNNGGINMEEIANVKPDVALLWDSQTKEREQLEKLGIAPVMINSDTIDNLKAGFSTVGQLLGKEKRSDEINKNYDEAHEYLLSKEDKVKEADKVKVLFMRGETLQLQSFSVYVNDTVIELAGGENVAHDLVGKGNVELNMEQIYKWNPDIIFLTNFDESKPSDLYDNRIEGKDWSKISAVQKKQVYKTPKGIYRWDVAGVETPLMVRYMASKIQPEIFSDADFEKEVKTFYKDFFDYNLSADDMDFITNREANKESK